MSRICVLGTHHMYQEDVCRKSYLRTLCDLIDIHAVELVAEEAKADSNTHARRAVDILKSQGKSIDWIGIEIEREEREYIPDRNPLGIGTFVDLDFYMTREWIWVARVARRSKNSTLVICGLAHTLSLAEKFQSIRFDVETDVFLDKSDENLMKQAPTDCDG
ncbi:MAG TPA: hypothetical protein VEJ67_18460 [Candidatus Cybelea sp.]|nr:hypothetical protein [Candidatus Cybelea sp.]